MKTTVAAPKEVSVDDAIASAISGEYFFIERKAALRVFLNGKELLFFRLTRWMGIYRLFILFLQIRGDFVKNAKPNVFAQYSQLNLLLQQ